MKKYREYMDSVRAPDTLHQRLLGLEASGKRPIQWKKYGTMAAALVLVVGLGAWGLSKAGGWAALKANFDPLADHTSIPEIADAPVPDIALAAPGDAAEPGEKTIGGYEVIDRSEENAIAAYYILPYIEYGDVGGTVACLDWDIPQGATRRELTGDECIALMGGVDAVNTHLDWGEYTLTGWAAWYADGSFWGAYINGQKLPAGLPPYASYPCPDDRFEFAVTAGMLPPTCIVYPDSVTQEIRGLTVTADGHDSVATPSGGVDASARRISFMKENYGCRFDITGTSRALTEERVSRLVCRIADKGLDLSIFPGTTVPGFVPDYDPTYEDGVPGYDSDCPYCADGTPHTHPYNPGDAIYTCDICGHDFPAGSAHGHFFIGADGVCPDCGAVISAGAEHRCPDDAMCSGYPVPETCPDCGESYAAGTEHHCAGVTHTCPICGNTFPSGADHHCTGGTYICDICGNTFPVGTVHNDPDRTHTCDICGAVLPIDVEHAHEACGYPLAPPDTATTRVCEVCGQSIQDGAAHSHSEGHHGGHH